MTCPIQLHQPSTSLSSGRGTTTGSNEYQQPLQDVQGNLTCPVHHCPVFKVCSSANRMKPANFLGFTGHHPRRSTSKPTSTPAGWVNMADALCQHPSTNLFAAFISAFGTEQSGFVPSWDLTCHVPDYTSSAHGLSAATSTIGEQSVAPTYDRQDNLICPIRSLASSVQHIPRTRSVNMTLEPSSLCQPLEKTGPSLKAVSGRPTSKRLVKVHQDLSSGVAKQ